MFDTSSTSPELAASGVEMAVLPVGAVEQHGPHLPISVDWRTAEALARGVAERLGAFLLAALPYGNSQAHAGFCGSISLQPETLQALVTDIVGSLAEQGFQKVVVLNTHGGNLVLKLTVRALNASLPDCSVLLVHPRRLAEKRLAEVIESLASEQHAGELETSLMLYLWPEWVREGRVDCVPDVSPAFFDYAPMRDYCPEGIWGVPGLATAEKGRKALEIMIEETVRHVGETFRRLEELQPADRGA